MTKLSLLLLDGEIENSILTDFLNTSSSDGNISLSHIFFNLDTIVKPSSVMQETNLGQKIRG